MKYILLTLFMILSTTKYETQKYDLVFSEDDFEIRFYHSSLKAKVVSQRNSNGNFYKLFQFISGNNSKGEKIEMTSKNLLFQFLKHPLMSFKVILAIHFEALRLWVKGVKLVKRKIKIKNNLSIEN